jgi:hypothetical protein
MLWWLLLVTYSMVKAPSMERQERGTGWSKGVRWQMGGGGVARTDTAELCLPASAADAATPAGAAELCVPSSAAAVAAAAAGIAGRTVPRVAGEGDDGEEEEEDEKGEEGEEGEPTSAAAPAEAAAPTATRTAPALSGRTLLLLRPPPAPSSDGVGWCGVPDASSGSCEGEKAGCCQCRPLLSSGRAGRKLKRLR